jgi:hypothetical protein
MRVSRIIESSHKTSRAKQQSAILPQLFTGNLLIDEQVGCMSGVAGLAQKTQDFGEFLADCFERRTGIAEQRRLRARGNARGCSGRFRYWFP